MHHSIDIFHVSHIQIIVSDISYRNNELTGRTRQQERSGCRGVTTGT